MKRIMQNIVLISFIITLFMGFTGVTYSYFQATVLGTGSTMVVDIANLSLKYTDTNVVSGSNILPGWSITKTFTVQNTGDAKVNYRIELIDVVNTFVGEDLVYEISSTNNGTITSERVVPSINGTLTVGSVEVNVTQTYTITIRFKETGLDQGSNMGKTFSGKLQVEGGIPDIDTAYERNGLVVFYDGEYNAGSGINHSNSTTTWKNLASTTNVYNGTINGATWGDNYLEFDGTNDWVAIAELNYDNPTIEAIYSSNQGTTGGYIVSNINQGGYTMYTKTNSSNITTISSNYYYLGENYNYNLDINYLKATIDKTNKYNTSISLGNSEQKLYLNGILKSTTIKQLAVKPPTNNTIMALGCNPLGSSSETEFFKGKIYAVRIYNRTLTQSEIESNYNMDKIRYGLS